MEKASQGRYTCLITRFIAYICLFIVSEERICRFTTAHNFEKPSDARGLDLMDAAAVVSLELKFTLFTY